MSEPLAWVLIAVCAAVAVSVWCICSRKAFAESAKNERWREYYSPLTNPNKRPPYDEDSEEQKE